MDRVLISVTLQQVARAAPNAIAARIPEVLTQGDAQAYRLHARIFDGSTEIDYGKAAIARVIFARGGQLAAVHEGVLSSEGVTYDVTATDVSLPGANLCSIQLLDENGARLTVGQFLVEVRPDPLSAGQPVPEWPDVDQLTQLIHEAQTVISSVSGAVEIANQAAQTAQEAVQAAQGVVDVVADAEDAIQAAETATQAALGVADDLITRRDAGDFDGPAGRAATVAVGQVSTVDEQAQAEITNVGTASDAVLNFKLPKGIQGPPGQSITGPVGEPGRAATVAVGTITTGEPGTQADVTNRGTSSDAILDFKIPRGATGSGGGGGASTWDEIDNKPDTFRPSPHTHDQSEVTDLPAALTAKADATALTTHTSDAAVHVSTAEQTKWDGYDARITAAQSKADAAIPSTQKNAASGVAPLDNNTRVPAANLPAGTTSASGIVQLNSTTNSTSTTQAATASAVKAAYDLANAAIPASQKAAASGVAPLDSGSRVPTTNLPAASTSASGIVQLNSATNSTSATQAATPAAVKLAYDRADAAFTQASDGRATIAGAIGSPATASDTHAQLAGRVTTAKDALAANLTDKGVEAEESEALAVLAGKVAVIETVPILVAGDYTHYTDGTSRSLGYNVLTKTHGVKIQVPAASVRISFTMGSSNVVATYYPGSARIYKNGVAVGQLRSAFKSTATYTEDIACVQNDIITIQGKTDGDSGNQAWVSGFTASVQIVSTMISA